MAKAKNNGKHTHTVEAAPVELTPEQEIEELRKYVSASLSNVDRARDRIKYLEGYIDCKNEMFEQLKALKESQAQVTVEGGS